MANGSLCSVIVPTFNERENIAVFLQLLAKHMDRSAEPFEAIVVDDGSPDGTQEVIKRMQERDRAGRILLEERNAKLGLGTAYKAGLRRARGGFVALMDADLSHHPKELPRFLAKQRAAGADIVVGTRYSKGGGVYGWNWKRRCISSGANLLARFALGLSCCTDLTGAYRLYTRDSFARLAQATEAEGYAFQVEILHRARRGGMRIEELPICFVDRWFGESKLGGKEVVSFATSVARCSIDRLKIALVGSSA